MCSMLLQVTGECFSFLEFLNHLSQGQLIKNVSQLVFKGNFLNKQQ